MGKQAINAPRGETTFRVDPEAITIIGLDTEDGPEHELWDKRARRPINVALVHDIMDQGILEPVIVRVNGSTTECVAGRQRVKAARKANEILLEKHGAEAQMIKVPCIRRSGDEKALFGVMVSENANREGLDPLEEAALVQRAIAKGFSHKEAAIKFGCTEQSIRNRLQLLDASKKVKAALTDGAISATAALKLASLHSDEQDAALDEMLASGNTGHEAAAREARKRKGTKAGKGAAEPEYDPPGKRLLNKILAHENASEALDPLVLKTIKWLIGVGSPTAIKGLAPLIAEIESPE